MARQACFRLCGARFNNRPEDRAIRESEKFAGAFDGPPTFFEDARKERIDYTSDHRPLVCRFKVRFSAG